MIGLDLVFGRLWKSMGLEKIVRDLADKRRHGFDPEQAVFLTVLHRIFASANVGLRIGNATKPRLFGLVPSPVARRARPHR